MLESFSYMKYGSSLQASQSFAGVAGDLVAALSSAAISKCLQFWNHMSEGCFLSSLICVIHGEDLACRQQGCNVGRRGGGRTLLNSYLLLLMCTALLLRRFPSSNTELLGMICPAFYKQVVQIQKAPGCVSTYIGQVTTLRRSVQLYAVYQAAEDTWDAVIEPLMIWDPLQME